MDKSKTEKDPIIHLPRRDFLRGGAAVGTAGVLAGTIIPQVHAAGSSKIKIALIGCGGRGTGAAAQAMNADPNVTIWAMADAFQDKAEGSRKNLQKKYKDRVNVPNDRIFSGFDAFKNAIDSGVDMVILATPPGFRPPHFEYAVKQSKHVFMEKPVATDAPGIRTVLAAAKVAKEKNLLVQVGLQRRHENQYKETVKRIQDGAIGDFSFSRVYWNSGGVWVRPRKAGQTEMEYQMRNWYYFTWLCGDHINEQHIHNLDVSNWIKDAHPIRANAMGGREVRDDKETGEIFDHFFVEYEYADGSRMYSQCRHIQKCWNSVSEAVHGSTGMSDVNRSIIRPAEGKGDPWRFGGKRQGGHQQEWHDLFKAFHAGERPVEAEYGATSTMTAILGRMAAYSGQVVNWDDAIKSGSIMPDTLAWDAAPKPKPGPDGHYPSPKPGITKPY